jgi:hypothetical protein
VDRALRRAMFVLAPKAFGAIIQHRAAERSIHHQLTIQATNKMIILSALRVLRVTVSVAAFFAIIPGSSSASGSSKAAAYDTKVRFEQGRALRFPDFELTYLGKHHVEPPQYPRGWRVHDFIVRSKAGEQTVSWSAGTGDIAPRRFTVNGAEFQLELSHSDKLGTLREDELVVSHLPGRE